MLEQQKPLEEIIAELIGQASMLWSETPKGIFQSEKAIELCNETCKKLSRRVYLEAAIRGHMEAMRPLLDEWSGKL